MFLMYIMLICKHFIFQRENLKEPSINVVKLQFFIDKILSTKKYDGQLFVLLVKTLFYIMYVSYKYTLRFNNFSFVFYLEFS